MPFSIEKHGTTLTRATKVASVFLGVFFVFYGGMAGLFGVGPAGVLGFPMRLVGAVVVFVGVIFMLPNSVLDRIRWIFYFSVVLVFTSSTIMLFFLLFHDDSMVTGYAIYGMILVLSIAAITSFWGYRQRRRMSDKR
jgi:hypothetical protein